MLNKIISGGQTGADRAALDVTKKFSIPHGGWVPKDRLAEDGSLIIPGPFDPELDLKVPVYNVEFRIFEEAGS